MFGLEKVAIYVHDRCIPAAVRLDPLPGSFVVLKKKRGPAEYWLNRPPKRGARATDANKTVVCNGVCASSH